MLLMSSKFWLWTIFSTMSSASMRVSWTQEGCFSTVSCFRLGQDGGGDDDEETKVEKNSRDLRAFTVTKGVLQLRPPVPGGSVERQHRPWGSGGSFWTSSVPLALCRRVGVGEQTPRSAAACRGVPAVREIRQAGGAGVLGAVACRTRRPPGGDRAAV